MPFIARRADNSIYGAWSVRQTPGQEELPDDHPEVVAFRAPKPPIDLSSVDNMEKSLKALLFAQGVEFRRTHDLFELADKLQACGVAVPSRVESVGKLNPYAVSFRYDSHDADLMSLEQADQIARDVLNWAAANVAAVQP